MTAPETNLVAQRAVPTTASGSWAMPDVLSLTAFRWLLVACEAATLLITWPLWQTHRTPPMLPLLPLPDVGVVVDLGLLLLFSLMVIFVRPLLGVAMHSALLLYAIGLDETRLQPEIVSLTLLMWATLPLAGALTVGRFHLVTLWCWAGINKLLSPAFFENSAPWMLAGLLPNAPGWLSQNFGYVVALTELGTGVLAFVPRTRRLAAVTALALHGGILLVLSPLGQHFNESIWPWNVALAASGFALIAPWRSSPWRSFLSAPLSVRLIVALLIVTPAGFYLGVTPAYLAHNLYSDNTASTLRCDAAGNCRAAVELMATYEAFNVPLPPEPRAFRHYFDKTCRAGERLIIRDGRRWADTRGVEPREYACPER